MSTIVPKLMTVPKRTRIESDVSSSTKSLKFEVALGWDFFGDLQSPSRGSGMGIRHFGLDQKIPGDEDRGFCIPENPQ